jgi:hypothetical protein
MARTGGCDRRGGGSDRDKTEGNTARRSYTNDGDGTAGASGPGRHLCLPCLSGALRLTSPAAVPNLVDVSSAHGRAVRSDRLAITHRPRTNPRSRRIECSAQLTNAVAPPLPTRKISYPAAPERESRRRSSDRRRLFFGRVRLQFVAAIAAAASTRPAPVASLPQQTR